MNQNNGGNAGKLGGGGGGQKRWACTSVCCLAVTMEHMVTYQGIKCVPIKIITDRARKGVASMWYSKLLTRATEMAKMIKN